MAIQIDPGNPKGIVWLASYPRSGNTWARVFFSGLLKTMTGRGDETLNLDDLDQFSTAESDAGLFGRFLPCPVLEASPTQIAHARPQVHRFLVDNSAGIVLVKTHGANVTVFGVPQITQSLSAGAIYLVRNPLDVAISFARFRDVSIDQAISDLGSSGFHSNTTAERVFELAGSWTEHVTTWTVRPHPTLLVVRYENMVAKPKETFAAIANHVLMKCSPEELDAAIAGASFERLREQEEDGGFRERPPTAERFFRDGRAGQWRDVLSAEQVKRIVSDHGEQMRRFDYLPE